MCVLEQEVPGNGVMAGLIEGNCRRRHAAVAHIYTRHLLPRPTHSITIVPQQGHMHHDAPSISPPALKACARCYRNLIEARSLSRVNWDV